MAEDVHGLLARINQPSLRYLTFADPEEGPEDRPAAVETLAGGEAELARTSRPRRTEPEPTGGGLLRRYRTPVPERPPSKPAPGNQAIVLRTLFDQYARLMASVEKRRA